MVALVPVDKTSGLRRTTTSLARYNMAVHLGRHLLPTEQVDHIDEDRLNDAVDNLQILTRAENAEKYRQARGVKLFATFRCPNCGLVFRRAKSQSHLAKGGVFTSCSRRCGGTLRRKVQTNPDADTVVAGISTNVVCVEGLLPGQRQNSSTAGW